jgi:hypothetical protein
MLVRLMAALIMIGVGAFAFHIVLTKPQHPFCNSPFDQALGIPRLVTRVLRGALGLLFIILGMISILRATGIIS